MNKSTEVLMAARDTIKDDRNWCKGIYAKDIAGNSVNSESDDAVQFCMYGALSRCERILRDGDDIYHRSGAAEIIYEVMECLGLSDSMSFFNDDDSTTHDDVINIYNKAIEKSLDNK